jgi:flagellar biosynthetic protein FliP
VLLIAITAWLSVSAVAQNANPSGPVSVDSPGGSAEVSAVDNDDAAPPSPLDAAEELGIANPIQLLSRSGQAINALNGGAAGVAGEGQRDSDGNPLDPASAANQGLSTSLSILLLLTILTLVPAILVMCTSFTRIVVVLALLRQALGTQTLPPTQVIVGLSLFLTFLVMAPTLDRINTEVLQPMQDPDVEMNEIQAWEKAKSPLRDFMFAQIDHAGNWDSVYMLMEWREPGSTRDRSELRRADVDMLTLIPAFMLSELKVAFLLGFRLYLPFLVIDMVISSVLISMGMLMLPPVLISLPFKLLLFVLVDGWNLVVANLLSSFAPTGVG